jgi:hypothetical protein
LLRVWNAAVFIGEPGGSGLHVQRIHKLIEHIFYARCKAIDLVTLGYGWNAWVTYWASATSDGINCEDNWAWCPNGTEWVDRSLWLPGEPNSPFFDYCGIWNYQPGIQTFSKLDNTGCLLKHQYICEVEFCQTLIAIFISIIELRGTQLLYHAKM